MVVGATFGIAGFVAFAVIVVVVIVFAVKAAAVRRKELAAWCQQRGYTMSTAKDRSMHLRYGDTDCLKRGRDRYAFNIMRGVESNGRICAFDYHYKTGSGKHTRHHRFSAVILEPDFLLNILLIRREHFFDKVTEFAGFDDIDFESAEFSRKFFVKSPDRRWAYDVINQATMEFLLASPRLAIEFCPNWVIAYDNTQFSTGEFESALGVIVGILERMPDDLKAQSRSMV